MFTSENIIRCIMLLYIGITRSSIRSVFGSSIFYLNTEASVFVLWTIKISLNNIWTERIINPCATKTDIEGLRRGIWSINSWPPDGRQLHPLLTTGYVSSHHLIRNQVTRVGLEKSKQEIPVIKAMKSSSQELWHFKIYYVTYCYSYSIVTVACLKLCIMYERMITVLGIIELTSETFCIQFNNQSLVDCLLIHIYQWR